MPPACDDLIHTEFNDESGGSMRGVKIAAGLAIVFVVRRIWKADERASGTVARNRDKTGGRSGSHSPRKVATRQVHRARSRAKAGSSSR
jgi:hypothetical protein